jgi:hypothetical protein
LPIASLACAIWAASRLTVGGAVLVGSLAGCELFAAASAPCGNPLAGCAFEEVMSEPPRNDPLSSSLATPTPAKQVIGRLSRVVRAQYAALGRRWPEEPRCQEIAAVGCRYLITLRYIKAQGSTCEDFVFVVEPGTHDGPVVRREQPLLFTHYACDKRTLGTPIGGVRP